MIATSGIPILLAAAHGTVSSTFCRNLPPLVFLIMLASRSFSHFCDASSQFPDLTGVVFRPLPTLARHGFHRRQQTHKGHYIGSPSTFRVLAWEGRIGISIFKHTIKMPLTATCLRLSELHCFGYPNNAHLCPLQHNLHALQGLLRCVSHTPLPLPAFTINFL